MKIAIQGWLFVYKSAAGGALHTLGVGKQGAGALVLLM